ncbi:MAG: hypothetical protein JWO45_681 [Spartobacteria bacterium]|nr:hypothetical protein [Spartobacteria bacterium]
MSARPLVIITTRLAPQICGVGAHSWQLQRHWPEQNPGSHFLVVDGAEESIRTLGYSAITQFGGNSSGLSLALKRLGSVDILLHYAAGPFSRLGCPFWLPRTLQKWKKESGGRLLVFFHEMPAKLPVTNRRFWTALGNQYVIGQLARLADAIITNTDEHADRLRRLSRRGDVQLAAVGSNIDPQGVLTDVRERTEFVVFGLPFGRWQTLQSFDQHIRVWQREGLLTKLHLIGPSDEKFDTRSGKLIHEWPRPNSVIEHGLLPANEVSQVLARARFGLTNATVENWSKSGVFMAYAAHRCAVIAQVDSNIEPLCFCIRPQEVSTIAEAEVNERARLLGEWYSRHADWHITARKISDLVSMNNQAEAMT